MRRYHFHLYDGSTFIDEEGSEFASIEDARREALHFLAATLIDSRDRVYDGAGWRLDVTNGDMLVFSVRLCTRLEVEAADDGRVAVKPDIDDQS